MEESLSKQSVKEKLLESLIWDAVCSIRGAKPPLKYKNYVIPLIFNKLLCDFFYDEFDRIAKEVGSSTKLGAVKVGIPPTLDEQKEIASALATTEQKILMEMSKKIQIQNFFHTLLHQLIAVKIYVHGMKYIP
ncbi:MAG: type I restriction-modification system subunit M N-terminal domain-containing protein [Verrucomicrobiota bacterium]